MKKSTWKIACASLLSLFILFGCGTGNVGTPDGTPSSAAPSAVSSAPGSQTPDSTMNNTPPDDSGTTAGDGDVTDDADDGSGTYNPDFMLILQAEDAEYYGKVRVESKKKGFTGTGYLTGFEGPDDTVVFHVAVPGTGAYDLNFISVGNVGHKENDILVDGVMVGIAKVDGEEFTDSIVTKVYMTAGEHTVQVRKSWGWILLDSLVITASAPPDKTVYDVSADLVDPRASDRTKRLMRYLADMYGKYIISGQYGDKGIDGYEFKAIYNETGKYPAMLGLDFIEYTPSRVAYGSIGHDVEYAIEFDKRGGIVTFCWHWNAPDKYLVNSSNNPWWRGFYTDATNIDLGKIMNGEDEEGYDLLISDIDAIAVQLKRLQDADIPVLWRPLHEASGGWFWWGASGPEPYIKLYRLLFDRLVNYHGIHNLIWVWNGQHKDWYPGDEYVDIVGIDIYPGEKIYSSQAPQFDTLVNWNGENRKIIAMTENGCLFDPDLAFRDNAIWSYFGTWEGEFMVYGSILSEKYTEKEMVKKVYTSDKVITLDELPDLKTY
jgi:mannan endo-1,4-beta-mannosidase